MKKILACCILLGWLSILFGTLLSNWLDGIIIALLIAIFILSILWSMAVLSN